MEETIEIINEEEDLPGKPVKKIIFNWYLIWISILLMCILVVCIFTALKVLTHYNAFSSNPLIFGAEQYDINLCTCLTNSNIPFFFNQSAIWQTTQGKPQEINFSALDSMLK